jgi:hypothetical protein
MRILADFHHTELYHSLKLLFEGRLGFELYRQIGMEWQEQGYWKVFDHPATALQFLSINQQEDPGPPGLDGEVFEKEDLENWEYAFQDDIYYVRDFSKDVINKAITLDKFKDTKFDILIASIPQHINPFLELIRRYQPQAKLIFQVGNSWTHFPGVKNILSSTAPFAINPGVNICFYHQEFDLNIFRYVPPESENNKVVNSYIHYMKELNVLDVYKTHLPDWRFTTYGAGMDDVLHNQFDISNTIINSGWTWHIKPEGDGYGHSLYNSYACGRPTIINCNYYAGKSADTLLEDTVTCIDIGNRGVPDNIEVLKNFSNPDAHAQMCENAYNRFCEVVNFDEEEIRIRKFIENLR